MTDDQCEMLMASLGRIEQHLSTLVAGAVADSSVIGALVEQLSDNGSSKSTDAYYNQRLLSGLYEPQ